MSDISTKYLGMNLRSPLLASASPLSESLENIKRLEDQNLGAVVLPSLFEEQLQLESFSVDSDLARGAESFPESANFLPDLQTYNLGPDGYLELIRHAKESVDIPIIASLNGVSKGGWLQYAKLMEEAGADAIEMNIYSIATDPAIKGSELEQDYIDLVHQLKRTIRIPVAVKLSPFFTAPANMGVRLDEARVDGIVLFNRFYQPEFDIEHLEITPNLSLSRPEELLLRLHWTAILCGHVRADLAITGGVHSSRDLVKCILAGAKVAFMTSALLRNGVHHAAHVLTELDRWLEEHEYNSVQQMCGSMSQGSVPDPGAFERGNYMKVLSSYTLRANVFND
ncbi:MAG TPA: dihydroorotate dehydrogenase-like protein [Verrucomicrobiae bacterium]|nr:dihydroorotate dehydrogenase-like protein [Verrucomicrobiae bacterium]